jgi:hypothetical protein
MDEWWWACSAHCVGEFRGAKPFQRAVAPSDRTGRAVQRPHVGGSDTFFLFFFFFHNLFST